MSATLPPRLPPCPPRPYRIAFDRLLVAQATAEAHALVSADADLAAYGIDVFW